MIRHNRLDAMYFPVGSQLGARSVGLKNETRWGSGLSSGLARLAPASEGLGRHFNTPGLALSSAVSGSSVSGLSRRLRRASQ
jgi:hypothetical protein